MAEILALPSVKANSQPVGHIFRLGDTGHRQLADLHAEGRFSPNRVVVDASRLHHQRELIRALRASGAQIILDTKVAELAAPAKFSGFASGAPWSEYGNGRPLGPEHFGLKASNDVIGRIARFAVENGLDRVLAPTHWLATGAQNDWFKVDQRSCVALRDELDRAGGNRIAIDYLLIIPHVALDEIEQRGQFIAGLKDLPFDNLWLRASGFGADARPLTTTRYISALSAIHNIGHPIVADYLGGLIGLAAVSFGAISGFAEGIGGELERFDARSWHKPPVRSDDDHAFGRTKRIAISGFGRSVTVDELQLLHDAKGGRRLVVCNDRNCCPHGLPDMLANPKRHSVYQRVQTVQELERIPDLNRAQYFLDGDMARADRLARQIKELKTGEAKLNKRMTDHSRRIEKLRSTLEHFHSARGSDAPRASAIKENNRTGAHRGVG
jgi:hypothetical protein